MTRDERLDLMDRLQRENAESRMRSEERTRQREADPIAYDDFVRSEPIGAAPMRKSGAHGLVYRTNANGAQAPAAAAVFAQSSETDEAWNAWLRGHLDIERVALMRGFGEAVYRYVQEKLIERDRALAELRAENIELKAMLADALKRLDAELEVARRDRAAAHALTVRLARLEGLFAGRMSQLAAFADAHGVLS
jgi:hypothetical protein